MGGTEAASGLWSHGNPTAAFVAQTSPDMHMHG